MWWLFPWLAIFFISTGYWLQVLKVHMHKEVRDLSILYHVFLIIGFSILFVTAVHEGSVIFMFKQIAAFVPVFIILTQIFKYRKSRWHDEDSPSCSGCKLELEKTWEYCPKCGTKVGQL